GCFFSSSQSPAGRWMMARPMSGAHFVAVSAHPAAVPALDDIAERARLAVEQHGGANAVTLRRHDFFVAMTGLSHDDHWDSAEGSFTVLGPRAAHYADGSRLTVDTLVASWRSNP